MINGIIETFDRSEMERENNFRLWNISRELLFLFIFDVSSPCKKVRGKRKWDRKNNGVGICEHIISSFDSLWLCIRAKYTQEMEKSFEETKEIPDFRRSVSCSDTRTISRWRDRSITLISTRHTFINQAIVHQRDDILRSIESTLATSWNKIYRTRITVISC